MTTTTAPTQQTTAKCPTCDEPLTVRMAMPRVGGPNYPQTPKVFVCPSCFVKATNHAFATSTTTVATYWRMPVRTHP